MSQPTEAPSTVAPSVPETSLTATIPPSGRLSPTGKPRGFLPPQTTATNNDTATFQAAPDAPCAVVPWCREKGLHVEHVGRPVNLPAMEVQVWQDTDDAAPTITVGNPQDDYRSLTSGDELRAEVARRRAGLIRMDALADEFDAIREATGETVEETPDPDKIRQVVVETGPVPPQGIVMYTQHGDELHVVYDPERARLAAVADHVGYMLDDQRLAGLILQAGALTEPPRTWSFIDRDTHAYETYTCMLGCPSDHSIEQDKPYRAVDVSCWLENPGVDVPIEAPNGKQRIETMLGITTKVLPLAEHKPMAARLPHVDVEVIEDCFIKELDPDGMQVVIDLFQARVDAMRAARLHLIAARAQWLRQSSKGGTR